MEAEGGCKIRPLPERGREAVTDAEEVVQLKRLLGWVFYRSRHGMFHAGSKRDAALADVNYWTEPYDKFYTSPMNPTRNGRVYYGETP